MRVILVLMGFYEMSGRLVRIAHDLALALHSRVYLLHVASPEADFEGPQMRTDVSRKGIANELRTKRRWMRACQNMFRRRGIEATVLVVRSKSSRGKPTRKILQEIDRLKPDLIIMGTHGYGRLHQMLLGSTSAAVIRRSKRPVLLVPAGKSSAGSASASDRFPADFVP